MCNTIIKTLNEFYNYADANVFKHTDALNLKIDIDKLEDVEKYQVQLIVNCLKYTIQAGKLRPFFTDANGNAYPDIGTITENDINYLTNYLNESTNLYIIAKINHLLFIKSDCKNKINFANNAIDAYLELFNKYLVTEHDYWLELSYIFNNLTDLVFKAKYKINELKLLSINIVKTSNKNVLIRDAAKFLIERVKKKKFDKSVLKGFIDICKTKIKNSNDNMNWTECFIELGRKISQIQNGNLRQWDLLQAKTYENEMKKAQQINNNSIAAASWCKDAIKYYKKAKNKIKADKLFKKYSDLCKTIQYATIDGPPYNLQTDIDKLKDFIDKSNNLDVLNEIIYGFIPKYENNKKTAQEILKNSSLTNFCSSIYTDIYGQVIGYASTDEEKFKHELWNSYKISFHFSSILLFHYIQYALKTNKLNIDLLLEYLKTTWFGIIIKKQLPENQILVYQWLEHIEQPIISYFNKQQKYLCDTNFRLTFINEVDSLTLKIEGILRYLIELAHIEGFSVRKFVNDKNGRQVSNWKSINELLWDSNISKILNEDDVWFMRYFLTDYLDVRNNIAHCLILNPYQEQYYYGFQWLLIIILRLSKYVKLKNSLES